MIVGLGLMILALSGAPATSVGPIYAGQSVAAVRQLLGPGSPTSACQPDPQLKPGDCPLELDYGDGKNVLKIGFAGAGTGVLSIEVDFDAAQSGSARARVARGAFATWRWAGHAIDRLPAVAIAGWRGDPEPPHKDCLVRFAGPARPGGAQLVASYGCTPGTDRIGMFRTGYVDP